MDKIRDIENNEITEKTYSHPADFLREIFDGELPFKGKYDRMPTDNGKIMRYYLKNPQIDFINELASKLKKSPSETLRVIVSNYKEINLLMQRRL